MLPGGSVPRPSAPGITQQEGAPWPREKEKLNHTLLILGAEKSKDRQEQAPPGSRSWEFAFGDALLRKQSVSNRSISRGSASGQLLVLSHHHEKRTLSAASL